MKHIQTNIIVFITGAFFSNSIWDDWRIYFESNGYITIAPPWPHKDATTDDLKRRHPDASIAAVDLQELVVYYSNLLKNLPEKTILIGHSAGGLVTQLLLQQGIAAAGVVIHSFPPHGVMTFEYSFLRSAYLLASPFTSEKKSFLMPFSQWQYSISNGMTLEQQKSGYEQFLVPESKKILRAALMGAPRIDFHETHPPLLFISGSADKLMPASLNYANYKNYKQNSSITSYREFKGKNHFVIRAPAWQDEAAFILHWIRTLQTQ